MRNRSIFAAALLTLLVAGALPAAEQPQPNIVVFYIDDMGYAQPSSYGGQLAPTPNMDAIVAAGVRFTNGYVSACVCSPSRVGLLTGRYQQRTGHDANSNRRGREMALSETTVAQRLSTCGYTTAIVQHRPCLATASRYHSRSINCPVIMLARLGVQIELLQNTRSKRIPPSASESIVGVGFSVARRLP